MNYLFRYALDRIPTETKVKISSLLPEDIEILDDTWTGIDTGIARKYEEINEYVLEGEVIKHKQSQKIIEIHLEIKEFYIYYEIKRDAIHRAMNDPEYMVIKEIESKALGVLIENFQKYLKENEIKYIALLKENIFIQDATPMNEFMNVKHRLFFSCYLVATKKNND
jgi:hypothetical protein